MSRLIFSVAVFVAFLMSLIVLSVRAAPQEDPMLQAFLVPQGCPQPCLMGIRPGITSQSEAVAILQAHPWVDRLTGRTAIGGLSWTWNGQQPDFLDWGGFMVVDDDGSRVLSINLGVRAPLGDVRAVLGKPTRASGINQMHMAYEYSDQRIRLNIEMSCPRNQREAWSARTWIVWGRRVPNDMSEFYHRPCGN